MTTEQIRACAEEIAHYLDSYTPLTVGKPVIEHLERIISRHQASGVEALREGFIQSYLTPLLYELSAANAPLSASDCRDLADKIGSRIGGVVNRVETILAQLETIDTCKLAGSGLFDEAEAVGRARVFIDRLIGLESTTTPSVTSEEEMNAK